MEHTSFALQFKMDWVYQLKAKLKEFVYSLPSHLGLPPLAP
jgi:hypothetical protein